jgi:hypothetical protein
MEQITNTLLFAFGFNDVKTLATNVVYFVDSLKSRLPLNKKIDLGLRFVKKMIQETLEVRKKYEITDERLIIQLT